MQTVEKSQVAEVAEQLVALCRQGKFEEATRRLYADEIVSVEAHQMPEMPGVPRMPRETRGLAGVKKKGEWFQSNHDITRCQVRGPFTSEDKFAVVFDMDITVRATGQQSRMEEVAVYTVAGGKIVCEEFFYSPCPEGGNG